jgi:glycerophosphoryl diester phosphodiesterase
MNLLDSIEEIYKKKISKIITFLCTSMLLFLASKQIRNKSSIPNKIKKTSDFINLHKMIIESHRGMNKEVFENTLEAFSKAIEHNIDCIETDVWLTKDKVLAIVHGKGVWGNIKRWYGVSKSITNLTWKQLSKYRTIRDNLKMPTLNEVMELAKNKILINLEIKDPRIDLVFPYITDLIEKYDFYDQIFFTSFYYEYYNKTVEYNKKTGKNILFEFAYRQNATESEFDFTKKGNIMSIYWKNVTKEICDKAHANGMIVSASLRFDNENTNIYKKMIEYGVDIISCNEPSFAKKYRDFYYKKYNINNSFKP